MSYTTPLGLIEPVLLNLIFISQYTFNSITGTFKIPVPEGPTGPGATPWIAIDNDIQCDNMFLAGVNLAVGDRNKPSYNGKENFLSTDHLIHVLTCSLVDVVSWECSVILRLPDLCRRRHSHRSHCNGKYDWCYLFRERHQEAH